jgi:hypothetical protein
MFLLLVVVLIWPGFEADYPPASTQRCLWLKKHSCREWRSWSTLERMAKKAVVMELKSLWVVKIATVRVTCVEDAGNEQTTTASAWPNPAAAYGTASPSGIA